MRSFRIIAALALAYSANGEDWVTPVMACEPMSEIFTGGKQLVEQMWDGAFECVADEDEGYTMWFFDENNPNDEVSRTNFPSDAKPVPEMCELDYYHKEAPTAEGPEFTECHPWRDQACCHHETVESPKAINEAYGEGFEWDRCGKMSDACARFFVQEACFYECDVNMGNYRKYTDTEAETVGHEGEGNKWQIHAMPIKMSYCNAFYDACKNDLFCHAGNFWECKAMMHPSDAKKTIKKELPLFAILSIIAAGSVLLACIGGLIVREMFGKPTFGPALLEKREGDNVNVDFNELKSVRA